MSDKERWAINKQYLILGARLRKLVSIKYRYLGEEKSDTRRYGLIQPIRWEEGKKGLHILTWDVEKDNWRRFAVANIEEVTLTDKDWHYNGVNHEVEIV